VQDVLDILGVSPGPEDLVSPARETPVRDRMNIVIGLTRVVDEVVDENVPAPVVFESDASLPAGQVRVVPGAPGLKQATYSVTYKNGVEASRTLTKAGVARSAVPTRVITGTNGSSGGAQMLDVPGYNGPFARKMTVRTTWYNATHGAWAREDPNYGLTRSGLMLDYGICAVDPNVIPLGTRFYVPGYGICLAADTGGLVRGNHVDLGFPEEAGWNPWNTQSLDIYILG
jgi:3D (Asp-Asp-Asp) domain-containing protein